VYWTKELLWNTILSGKN